jgi:hypothetical protein
MLAATAGEGLGAASALAGETAVGRGLEAAANVAKGVGDWTNPLNIALKGAGAIASGAGDLALGGKGMSIGRAQYNAGKSSIGSSLSAGETPAQTFKRFMSGNGSTEEIKRAATQAVNNIRKKVSDAYLLQKSELSTAPVDPSKIYQAVQDMHDHLRNVPPSGLPEARAALQQVNNLVDETFKPNSAGVMETPTIDKVDGLKRAIGNLNSTNNGEVGKVTGHVYSAALQAMTDVDPEYAQLMEHYQYGLENINNLDKTFSLGNRSAASNTVASLLKQIKFPNGQDLLSQLSKENPNIPSMLAGEHARSLWPVSFQGRLGEGAMGALATYAGLALHNPAAATALAGSMVFGSPRFAGNARYYAGKTAGVMGNVADQLSSVAPNINPSLLTSAAGSIYHDTGQGDTQNQPTGGSPDIENYPVVDPKTLQQMPHDGTDSDPVPSGAQSPPQQGFNIENYPVVDPKTLQQSPHDDTDSSPIVPETQSPPQQAFGGRIQRASGGKVNDKEHEFLVNRLIKLSKSAKRDHSKQTEPLLNSDDTSIARALSVAQKSI